MKADVEGTVYGTTPLKGLYRRHLVYSVYTCVCIINHIIHVVHTSIVC